MTRRRVRWWPAVAIAALAVVAASWVAARAESGQERFVGSAAVATLAFLLLLVWALVFSGLPARVRLVVLAATALAAVAAGQLLEFRGVSGDLVPILGWRGRAVAAGELPEAGGGAAVALASERDYPQFLGPGRRAVLGGPALARDWNENPPRPIWRRPIGEGWSGFAVAGELAVTQEQRGAAEMVVAYRLADGEAVWAHRDAARYETGIGGVGPRATPTIADRRVFTLGATGRLNALDLATGRKLWSRDVLADASATRPEWGLAGSPLRVGEQVVVSAGGPNGRALLAYDAASGEPRWTAGDDRASYSSPLLATFGGRLQIVIFNRASVAGHDPTSGEQLWSHPWQGEFPNVSQPLPLGPDRLLVSTGYGVGSELLRIGADPDGFAVESLWRSPRLKAKFTNLVEHGGFVYGLDDGVLVCLDPETGERRWKSGRYGHGQVILVGDLLLVQAENGEVALVDPGPEGHRELARFAALEGKTWNPPALAGNRLLVRNHREAALYELPLAG